MTGSHVSEDGSTLMPDRRNRAANGFMHKEPPVEMPQAAFAPELDGKRYLHDAQNGIL